MGVTIVTGAIRTLTSSEAHAQNTPEHRISVNWCSAVFGSATRLPAGAADCPSA